MSIGMGFNWRRVQPKHKQCPRCELYFYKDLDYCTHCSELSDLQLITFKSQQKEVAKDNAKLGGYFLLGTLITAVFLLLSFI